MKVMKRFTKYDNGITSILYYTVCVTGTILALLPLNTNSASLSKTEPTKHANSRRHRLAEQAEQAFQLLKPSLVMIPLDLQESANKRLDPDVNNIDQADLLDFMGDEYDGKLMSLRRPANMNSKPNGTLMYKFTKDQLPKGTMPQEIAALSAKTITLSEGLELRVKFNRKTKRKIQKFLWSYSYCPVRYRWKELSIRFWPRWIKVGQCENKRSCSIPAGMTCQPSKMQNIKILRYYCPYSSKTCSWIKIEYPILAQCTCGCQQYRDSDYRT